MGALQRKSRRLSLGRNAPELFRAMPEAQRVEDNTGDLLDLPPQAFRIAAPLVASTRMPMAAIQLPATRTAMRIQPAFRCRR